MERYKGICELLCEVDVVDLVEWLVAIPLCEWPQQDRLSAAYPYPAMVTDQAWHGFGEKFDPLVTSLLQHFPGGRATGRNLSVVIPDQRIADHDDVFGVDWRVRVHVPLVTNPKALMWWNGKQDSAVNMEVGKAYKINTEIEHGLANWGDRPRIHFFFDVRE